MSLWQKIIKKYQEKTLAVSLRKLFLRKKTRFLGKDLFYPLSPARVIHKRFDDLICSDLTDLIQVGNYWIHKSIKLHENSIVYSGGLGGDADFDIALNQKFGCNIFIFDPTPSSIVLGNKLEADHAGLRFLPVGLWDCDGQLEFYTPMSGGSATAVVQYPGNPTFFAPVKSIMSVMKDLQHQAIDLVKLDIEGAAERVIWAMFNDGVFPHAIVCEFERPGRETLRMAEFFVGLNNLIKFCEVSGYEVRRLPRDDHNYFGTHLLFWKASGS